MQSKPEKHNGKGQTQTPKNPSALSYGEAVAEHHRNRAGNEQNRTNGNGPHWADKIMAFFTGLILLTYITSDYFLWKQMNLTQRAFLMDERPWVSLQTVSHKDNQNPKYPIPVVEIKYTNTGKTAAQSVTGHVTGFISLSAIPKIPKDKLNYQTNEAPDTLVPNQDGTSIWMALQKMPNLNEFMSGNAILYVVGEIDYKDSLGGSHRTEFCAYAHHSDSVMFQCSEHQYAD